VWQRGNLGARYCGMWREGGEVPLEEPSPQKHDKGDVVRCTSILMVDLLFDLL